jgi:hypothetical protein
VGAQLLQRLGDAQHREEVRRGAERRVDRVDDVLVVGAEELLCLGDRPFIKRDTC